MTTRHAGEYYEIRSIRVDPQEWEVAAIDAARHGESMSELVRNLIAEHNAKTLAK